MSERLLATLCCSPLDLPMGLELAKLWADIQPAKDDNIAIAIALRFDMDVNTVPTDIVDRLKEKFRNVYIFKSSLKGTGWPHGCNALEIGAYQWFVENARAGLVDADYMLICEPDTVPLRPTWLDEIRREAHELKAPIIGALFTVEDGCQHINGNCVLHKHMWKECKEIWGVPPGNGWDVYIGKKTTHIGKPSKLIWQDYRLGAPDNPWKGDDHLFSAKMYHAKRNPLHEQYLQPAMFHGCKTYQAIDAVRLKFGLTPRLSRNRP